MPKGSTNSVQKAIDTFEGLKKESLMKGKNLATIAKIAKRSGISRNNFYAKKSENWENITASIHDFAKDFKTLAQGKYKNPAVETYKKETKDYKKKYVSMAEQNYELLKIIDNLNRVINDKQQTINFLYKKLEKINISKEQNYEK